MSEVGQQKTNNSSDMKPQAPVQQFIMVVAGAWAIYELYKSFQSPLLYGIPEMVGGALGSMLFPGIIFYIAYNSYKRRITGKKTKFVSSKTELVVGIVILLFIISSILALLIP